VGRLSFTDHPTYIYTQQYSASSGFYFESAMMMIMSVSNRRRVPIEERERNQVGF